MKARSFDIGKVIEEINQNSIDASLREKAILKAKGIDQIILAHYIILRAEELASKEKFFVRKF